MPTGSGKSVTLAVLLHRTRTSFKSAVVATPLHAIVRSFTGIDGVRADTKYLSHPGFTGKAVFNFDGFWNKLTENERVKADLTAFQAHVGLFSSGAARQFGLVITHSALRLWAGSSGGWALPPDLTGRLLVIDEAHHTTADGTGTDLSEVRAEWVKRGGTVISATATPFRHNGGDSDSIFPDRVQPYTRTMAVHAQSIGMGFQADHVLAPASKTSTYAELIGERMPANAVGMIDAILKHWLSHGKPKSVCIVPGAGSASWTKMFVAAFRREGARVHDAVGPTVEQKRRLERILTSEREVKDFNDSTIDVIVACKRFDEGTDWPLCSQVYNINLPRSYGLVIQRWGRALRDKREVANYPEDARKLARITFVLSGKIDRGALAEYERKSGETALLIALFMADHNVASRFAPRLTAKRTTLRDVQSQQATLIPEHILARAKRDVVKKSFVLDSEKQWSEWVRGLPRSSVTQKQYARAVLRTLVASGFVVREPRGVGVDPALAAEFSAAVGEYRGKTSSTWIAEALRVRTEFTGETAEELRGRLGGSGRLEGNRMTLAEAYPELAAQWHPTKNGRLTPKDVSVREASDSE